MKRAELIFTTRRASAIVHSLKYRRREAGIYFHYIRLTANQTPFIGDWNFGDAPRIPCTSEIRGASPKFRFSNTSVHDRFLKVAISTHRRPERNSSRGVFYYWRWLVRQCDLQNLVHIFNEVEGELIFDVCWDVGKILLIVLGKDERPNSSPMSRQ